MNIWRVLKRRVVTYQSAAWHARVTLGLTDSQRRGLELWLAEPLNAREFRFQRALLDGVAELKGTQAKRILDSISAAAPVKLAKPPAARFVSALRWLLPKQSYAEIVAPVVAQEQREIYEAILHDDMPRARWIVVRMYVLICYSVLLALLASITKLFRGAD